MSELRKAAEAVCKMVENNNSFGGTSHWPALDEAVEALRAELARPEAKVDVPFDPYDKSDKEKAAQIYYGLSRAEQSAAPAPESEEELREKLKELFAGEPFYEMSTDEVIDQILALWRTKVLRTRFTGCACRSDMGHGQAPSRVGERR